MPIQTSFRLFSTEFVKICRRYFAGNTRWYSNKLLLWLLQICSSSIISVNIHLFLYDASIGEFTLLRLEFSVWRIREAAAKTEVVLKVCFCRKTFSNQEVADLLIQRISGKSLTKLQDFAGIRELQERKNIGNKCCKSLRTNGICVKKEKLRIRGLTGAENSQWGGWFRSRPLPS